MANGGERTDPGAADRADGGVLLNIPEYWLLIQPVRLNYQSWISVPIGQSVDTPPCLTALAYFSKGS